MAKYVIERDIPSIGELSSEELRQGARKSCQVLQLLGPEIEWEHSYVTDDKMYCIYQAPSEEIIRQHAEQSGFPAHKVLPVKTVINPSTAD